MSRQWNPNLGENSSPFSSDEISFRGNLDPERLVWLQIRECNIAHNNGDEMRFGNAVMGLLAIIPSSKRREIKARRDEYVILEERWVPWNDGGGALSADPDHPIIINRKGIDLDYDPNFNDGKEKQISPILKKEEKTDYYTLFEMIQDGLEESKLSWRIDQICEELGRIPDKKDPPPKPTLEPGVSIEKLEDDEEEEDEPN
jgi:hypothetical protein